MNADERGFKTTEGTVETQGRFVIIGMYYPVFRLCALWYRRA